MVRGALVAPLAVELEGLSKSFLLPHEQRSTIKEYFLHPFAGRRRTSYERNRAVRDVSFSIDEGEFFGIIGPNGSGKSTLLKLIAGIYRPDAGRVHVRGKLSPFIELGVGFNPELNGRDNVILNGTLLGLSRRQLAARFDSIFAFAELERFTDQKLKNYSSGMQLRLAFSIAIQVQFDVLLLDEVLAVGDLDFQRKCFAALEDLRAKGKTLVFVSHDLDSVSSFCDRALLIEFGAVRDLGPAADVVAGYRQREGRSEEVAAEPR
jgi:ABC-type polysaccharide/polyol phosphate transport system ATPase subunit